jgi:hypothetical protein
VIPTLEMMTAGIVVERIAGGRAKDMAQWRDPYEETERDTLGRD